MQTTIVPGRTAELLRVLTGRKRLLVLTHTNPDPDSIASAMGLRHLARTRLAIPSTFGLSGQVMRAENKEMVRCLGVDLVPMSQVDLAAHDAIALVDSQPGFGHTVLPTGRSVDIVVDHHVPPERAPAGHAPAVFLDLRTEVGATSSIVTSYLMESGVPVDADVATGLFYGIKTDTADLSRNTSPLDAKAYEFLLPRVDRQKLAAITTPDVSLDYFRALRTALNNIRIFGGVVLCSVGRTEGPEMMAEVADLLMRLEGRAAVFCGGLVGQTYYVSVRTEPGGRDAYSLIRSALGGEGSFGGHGSVAGGSIPMKDTSERGLKRLERRLERNILKALGVDGLSVGGIG
ncbi:MAG: DHH family phosphoesterase [Planctomycetes bacterium]|nr:DHH family phosphoesterase [Planctomycetota bacterium]